MFIPISNGRGGITPIYIPTPSSTVSHTTQDSTQINDTDVSQEITIPQICFVIVVGVLFISGTIYLIKLLRELLKELTK